MTNSADDAPIPDDPIWLEPTDEAFALLDTLAEVESRLDAEDDTTEHRS